MHISKKKKKGVCGGCSLAHSVTKSLTYRLFVSHINKPNSETVDLVSIEDHLLYFVVPLAGQPTIWDHL